MSRRKDKERFFSMKGLNPDYRGFRGYDEEPTRTGNTPLQAITCSICGRRRNVPLGIAEEQGDNYVCMSCSEGEEETQQDESGV